MPTFQYVSRLQLTDKVSFTESQTTVTTEQAAQMASSLHANNNYVRVGNYVYRYQTGSGEPCAAQSIAMTQAFDDGFDTFAAN